MQVRKIKVEMLGGFSVYVNNSLVVETSSKLTKPWQLFCYLVLHKNKFITSRKLISMLWADDLLTDPANVLKNAVYTLRKELCGGESLTESPIIYSTGGYRLDPAVKLELDIEKFMHGCEAAREAIKKTTANTEEKMMLCRTALASYVGDFLPQLDQELWAVPMGLDCKRYYIEIVHELSEMLWQASSSKELLEVSTAALQIEPLDEKTMVYLFRAMDELKMYRVIVTTFFRMVQRHEDALGGDVPLEAQRIYNSASERINKTEQDVIIIIAELTSAEQTSRPQRGAYYCSYSSMRHMYPLMRRAAERGSQLLVVALFTISTARGAKANQFDLVRAMAEFKVVAMNTLRKADAIARYSRNQYVMLLSVTSLEDGRLVRDRICDSFSNAAASRKMVVDVKLSKV